MCKELSDTLDGDGGADLAAIDRIRNEWMKFRKHLPFLTSRAPARDERSSLYQLKNWDRWLEFSLFVCLFVGSYSQGAEYWIKSDP